MGVMIERITLHRVEMRLVEVLITSFGGEALRPCIIVQVDAEGLMGWGECVADAKPAYGAETVDTAWHILRDHYAPVVLGQRIEAVSGARALLSRFRGNPMARAGLEAAVWDVLAQAAGKSLAAFLHDRHYASVPRETVPVGVSIGIQPDVQGTLAIVEKRLAEGYRRTKLKIRPGWDVQPAAAVRQHHPNVALMLDANSAYTPDDAPRLKELDALNLIMLEQPLWYDDIWQHSKLQAKLKTPICLDESIRHARDAEFALELGACRIINVKAGWVGGLWEARAIHDVCLARGAPAWVGGMLETGVGRAANLALASLPGFTLPGDISATNRYWEHDITAHFSLNADGTITVPRGPGLGVKMDYDRLAAVTTARETIMRRQGAYKPLAASQ